MPGGCPTHNSGYKAKDLESSSSVAPTTSTLTMCCCRVDRCCCCLDHVTGVKVLGCVHMGVEVGVVVVVALYFPQFLFAVGPASGIGILADVFLLVASFRSFRWLMLPWLIYVMIIIVGLCLAAVLQVVISVGTSTNVYEDADWTMVILGCVGCLAAASMLLYFWIVVLELFIRMGPPGLGHMSTPDGFMYAPPQQVYGYYAGPPPPPPPHARQIMYQQTAKL